MSLPSTINPAAVAAMTSSRPVGHGAVRAYDWLVHHTMHRPAKEAVRDLGTGRSFTYADLDRRADAMAAYLRSIGVGRGDRVGVLAHNGVEYFDIQFACARTGSICVLLNWRLTVAELEYILNDSSPALLHCVSRLAMFRIPNDITIVEALPATPPAKSSNANSAPNSSGPTHQRSPRATTCT